MHVVNLTCYGEIIDKAFIYSFGYIVYLYLYFFFNRT